MAKDTHIKITMESEVDPVVTKDTKALKKYQEVLRETAKEQRY